MSINVPTRRTRTRRPRPPKSAQTRPLLTEIDHIAIAVPDLGEAIDDDRERSAPSSTTARSWRATGRRRPC